MILNLNHLTQNTIKISIDSFDLIISHDNSLLSNYLTLYPIKIPHINRIKKLYLYPLSFKLPLCWLHSLTPVTSLSMLPGIRSLAVAIHLEIHRVYMNFMWILLCVNNDTFLTWMQKTVPHLDRNTSIDTTIMGHQTFSWHHIFRLSPSITNVNTLCQIVQKYPYP